MIDENAQAAHEHMVDAVKGTNFEHNNLAGMMLETAYLAGLARGHEQAGKLRAAIAKAGFGIMETSGVWSIHCTTAAADAAERVETSLITENIRLEEENRVLRAALHPDGDYILRFALAKIRDPKLNATPEQVVARMCETTIPGA